MKILIANVYSFQNKGDAAIVLSLMRETKRVFKKPDILIQTADTSNDKDKYDAPVTASLLWILLSSVRDRSIVLRLVVLLYGIIAITLFLIINNLFNAKPYFLLTPALKTYIRENLAADMVIACGGGYLRTPNGSGHYAVLLFVTCLNFLSAKYLGKPVYLYSQSIGPVHGWLQTKILRFTLKRVDLIEPREDVSVKYLDSLNLKTPIMETADPVLLLGGTGTLLPEFARKGKQMRVGLTVRKWFKTEAQLEKYMKSVAQVIDHLVEKYNAEVFYLPQVIAEKFDDDDRVIALKVKDYVVHKEQFNVIDNDLHPYEAIGLCGSADIFIGTRMHSNIFTLINGIPVVAIEYEHKTRGIMQGLGIEELTINIGDVTFETLSEKVEMLISNRDKYAGLVKTNLPIQIKKSQSAIEYIKDMYESKNTAH